MTDRVAAVALARVFNRGSVVDPDPDPPPPPTAGQARTRLGVYPRYTAGAGRTYLAQWEAWMNRTAYGVTQFGSGAPNDEHAVWASAHPSSPDSFTGIWKRTTIAETIGLASPALDGTQATALTSTGRMKIGANLQRSIDGELDASVAQTCAMLLAGGYTAPLIRIGWEANGHWYPWSVWGSPTNQALYAIAFRRLALLIKSLIPGALIDWNGTNFGTWADFEACYPGDDAVDIVSPDIYDMDYGAARSGTKWADEQQVWDDHIQPYLDDLEAFVYGRDATRIAAGRAPLQIAMPEWGPSGKEATGGGDNVTFVQNVFDWQQSLGARFEYGAVFETDDYDGPHAYMPPGGVGTNPNFPLASVKFKELWGNPGTGGGGGGTVISADPDLIAEGVAQLKWARSLRGTGKYFSGMSGVVRQFTTGLTNFNEVQSASGARPLFMIIDGAHAGTDATNPSDPSTGADFTQSILAGKAHAASGGLLEMNYHAVNPINGLSTNQHPGSMPTNTQVGRMSVPGTSENAAFVANYLGPLRTALLSFQADRIPVWLRLFHEWGFWWSFESYGISKANLRALWIYAYQWLWANDVHNIITVYGGKGAAGEFADDWRPPWSMIDSVGLSIYDTPSSSFDYPFYAELTAQDKICFAGEFGPATWSPSFQAVLGYNAVTGLLAAHADEPSWVGDIWWWDPFDIYASASNGVPYMQDSRVINLGESTWLDFLV